MKKLVVTLLSILLSFSATAGIENSVKHEGSDGNYHIYSTIEGNVFIDASKDWHSFVSISIPFLSTQATASYAIIPAKNLQQMSDNHYLAKIFTVDCENQTITNEDGLTYEAQMLSDLHHVAMGTSCDLWYQHASFR